MPHNRLVVPDRGLVVNGYRILQRADYKWIVYDHRLPLGHRTVRVFGKRSDAEMWAMNLPMAEAE